MCYIRKRKAVFLEGPRYKKVDVNVANQFSRSVNRRKCDLRSRIGAIKRKMRREKERASFNEAT